MYEATFWCSPDVLDEFAKHFSIWENRNGVCQQIVDYREFKIKIHWGYRGLRRTRDYMNKVEVRVVCRYLYLKEKKHYYKTENGQLFYTVLGRFGEILRLV